MNARILAFGLVICLGLNWLGTAAAQSSTGLGGWFSSGSTAKTGENGNISDAMPPRPKPANAKKPGSPAKPSHMVPPQSGRMATEAPRFTPNAATSQGKYVAADQSGGPINPHSIVPEEVPTIPRRSGTPTPYQPKSSTQFSGMDGFDTSAAPTGGASPQPGISSQVQTQRQSANWGGANPGTTSPGMVNPGRNPKANIPPQVVNSQVGSRAKSAGTTVTPDVPPASASGNGLGTLKERLAAARRNSRNTAPVHGENVAADNIVIESNMPSDAIDNNNAISGSLPENSAPTPFGTANRFNPNSSINRQAIPAEVENPLAQPAPGTSPVSSRNSNMASSRKVDPARGVLNRPLPTPAAGHLGGEEPGGTDTDEQHLDISSGNQPSATSSEEELTGRTLPSSARKGNSLENFAPRTASRDNALPSVEAPGATPAPLFITRQSPQIAIETTGPRTITVGKEAVYVLTIRNSGSQAAQDVTVKVSVPEFAEVISGKTTSGVYQAAQPAAVSATTGGMEPAQWNLPRLEANGQETLTLRLIPRKSRPLEIGVQWTVSPVTSQAVVEVQEPKLAMTLTGAEDVLFGQTKIYKLTLSNPGSGDAENVMIHLSPLTDQAAAMTKHALGTISAGDSKVVEVEMTARQAGKVAIKAIATADGGLQADAIQEVLVRRAELQVAVQGAKAKYAGTAASYAIHITNPGNAPAENVQLVGQLPTGAKLLSATGGQADNETGKLTWTLPTLRAGEEQTFEVKCLLSNPGPNKFVATASAGSEISVNHDFTTQVEALADLKLEVIEPKGPLPINEEVVYEIRLKNQGSKSAEQIVINGYFSEGIEPTGAIGGAHELSPGMVQFQPLATLAPGSEASVRIKARATAAGNLIFRAEAVCELNGTKLVQQSTQLYYDEQGPAAGPKPVAGPNDDINAPATLPSRSATDSARKQPAPVGTINSAPLLDSPAPAAGAPATVPVVMPPLSTGASAPSPTGVPRGQEMTWGSAVPSPRAATPASMYVPVDSAPAATTPRVESPLAALPPAPAEKNSAANAPARLPVK
ncbi:MAG: hypothetical protein SFX18_03990 [Pirellulales bacterium]|nr:hypothetical protein [Pirellulales bacterium]